MITIILLIFSNIFMTFAWYGHLKYQNVPLWKVTLVSWGLAFFEYCFQVPANRIGSHTFNAAQLKTIQEIITLVAFSVFSIWYLREDIKWNYAVGFFFIVVAAFLFLRSGSNLAVAATELKPDCRLRPAQVHAYPGPAATAKMR